jgi:hypothetical protein
MRCCYTTVKVRTAKIHNLSREFLVERDCRSRRCAERSFRLEILEGLITLASFNLPAVGSLDDLTNRGSLVNASLCTLCDYDMNAYQ